MHHQPEPSLRDLNAYMACKRPMLLPLPLATLHIAFAAQRVGVAALRGGNLLEGKARVHPQSQNDPLPQASASLCWPWVLGCVRKRHAERMNDVNAKAMNRFRVKDGLEEQFEQRWGNDRSISSHSEPVLS